MNIQLLQKLFRKYFLFFVLYLVQSVVVLLVFPRLQQVLFCMHAVDCRLWTDVYGQLIFTALLGWIPALLFFMLLKKHSLRSRLGVLLLVGLVIYLSCCLYLINDSVRTTKDTISVIDRVNGISVMLHRSEVVSVEERLEWSSVDDGGRVCRPFYYLISENGREVPIVNVNGGALFTYLQENWSTPYRQIGNCN